MHHQLLFDLHQTRIKVVPDSDKCSKMENRILIAVVTANFCILIIRCGAQDTQTAPEMLEVTTISDVTEQPGTRHLTNTPIERSGDTHVHVDSTFKGFWAKKFAWRPRWVKTWQEKKVYVAVWKRMWGPVEVKEWVPVPKPPPGWIKHDAGSYIVKKLPHH